MITPEQAWPHLLGTVVGEDRHPWYDETVEHAELCRKLITGDGADSLLVQITGRESDRQKELRNRIFFPLTRSICAKGRVPYSKVTRVDGTVTDYIYEGEGDNEKKKRLIKALDGFYGEENLDDYLDDRFLSLSMVDPNAFIVVEFEQFDHRRTTAQPYPLEISSEQAVNYGKRFNKVEWLVARFDHTFVVNAKPDDSSKDDEQEGDRFVMYFGWVLDCAQVQFNKDYPQAKDIEVREGMAPIYFSTKDKSYLLSLFTPFGKRQEPEFQGIQVGYRLHPDVTQQWYVSPIYPAIPRMLSTLKTGSEHSLVMSLVAHPEVWQFLEDCEGDTAKKESCTNGRTRSGSKCSECGGTGKKLPQSVLDAITLKMPLDKDDYILPLKDMKHFHSPDVAIIKALGDHVYQLEHQCLQDMFTATNVERKEAERTATRENIDADAQNSAVIPYARKIKTAHIKLAWVSACFVDADNGLTVVKEIPDDLQLEPLAQKIETLTMAKTSGSPDVLDLAEQDVVIKMLENRPADLQKWKVRRYFRPLANVSEDLRQLALTNGEITMREKVLLLYENEIYGAMDQVNGFYLWSRDKQREEIYAKVDEIVKRVKAEKAMDIDWEMETNEAKGLDGAGNPIEEEETAGAAA